MKQEAILFTRINAEAIAASLTGVTAQDLLEDHSWELETFHVAVLARDVLDSGFASVSYVVSLQMFEANNPGIQLTTEHFTHVRDI